MNNLIFSFGLLVLLFSQACSLRAETVFFCPQQISVAMQVVNPPAGWDVPSVGNSGESTHYLVSSTFTDGPPADRAFLKPSKTSKGPNSPVNVVEYDFSESTGRGIWQICLYGNTQASVSRRIPESILSCKVTIPKDLSEQKVTCQ